MVIYEKMPHRKSYFNSNLKLFIKLTRVTYKELGLSIGTKKNAVSTWVNYGSTPSLCIVQSIALFFDISLQDFITVDFMNKSAQEVRELITLPKIEEAITE